MNRPQSILIFLLSTLGFPIFEIIAKKTVDTSEILTLTGRGVTAEGDLIDDGFVIFKDSEAKKDEVPSCPDFLISLRSRLLKDGVLKEKGENLVFAEDYVFTSPSTAASIILGRSANGWTKWRDKGGRTLRDLRQGY
jgi:hypothetical protein